MSHLRSESVDRLFQTILALGSIDECYAYFEDLCTIKEVKDMAQRLDTAILLSQGYSYQKIMEHIEISSECTMCSPDRFWSHRITGNNRGSQGAIIVCKEETK